MAGRVNFSLTNNLPELNRQMKKEYERALLKATIRVHRELATVLSGSRSGREYRIPATNQTYKASREGDPPAVRLGHLRASYKYLVKGNGFDAIGYVGSPLEYAHYLEFGTAKMRPRPHLKLAFQRSKNDIVRYFGGLLR